MKSYIKDYPRPQFVRKEWQNLNGEWNFIFDDNMDKWKLHRRKYRHIFKIFI